MHCEGRAKGDSRRWDTGYDMKNPLVAIGGLARLLQQRVGVHGDSRRNLRFIVEGTDRLEALVKDMLDF